MSQSQSESYGEEKNLLPLLRMQPRLLYCPARNPPLCRLSHSARSLVLNLMTLDPIR
jgi:hypothetical protein